MLKNFIDNYINAYKGISPTIWFLSIVIFINRSGTMVLFFLSLYLTQKIGFSIPFAGKMLSVYGIGSLLGAYLGGWASDKIGAVRVQLTALAISGGLYMIFILWENPIAIIINLFFLGLIAESIRPATTTAIVQHSSPETRTRAFAVQRLAVNLGIAVGPAIGGFIARINYDFLFIIDGLTCLIAAIVLYIFMKTKLKTISHIKEKSVKVKVNPFTDKIFVLLILFAFLMGICFLQIISTWPLFLKNIYKINESGIGLLLTINTILIVLIEIPLIHRLEKKNKFPIMALGAILLCFGFGILPFGSTYGFVAFSLIFWTLGEIIIFPNLSASVSERPSENNVGKYMGIYSFAFALAFSFAPTVGTFIYDKFSPTILWLTIGGIGIVISLGFLILNKLVQKEKTSQVLTTSEV